MKIFRLSAYVVLLTLVLNLGDWPFVDEILAEYMHATKVSAVHEGLEPSDTHSFQATKADNKDSSVGDLSLPLTNFLDAPRHRLTVPKRNQRENFFAFSPVFVRHPATIRTASYRLTTLVNMDALLANALHALSSLVRSS